MRRRCYGNTGHQSSAGRTTSGPDRAEASGFARRRAIPVGCRRHVPVSAASAAGRHHREDGTRGVADGSCGEPSRGRASSSVRDGPIDLLGSEGQAGGVLVMDAAVDTDHGRVVGPAAGERDVVFPFELLGRAVGSSHIVGRCRGRRRRSGARRGPRPPGGPWQVHGGCAGRPCRPTRSSSSARPSWRSSSAWPSWWSCEAWRRRRSAL